MTQAIATPLCTLPPDPPGGCCAAAPPPPAAPTMPFNPPGLAAIAYRIGTFTTFRREMLDRVADPHLLDPLSNPFAVAGWHEGADGDYQTVLIELWAYLGDILTFYQERIANEAYLGTATQRDSMRKLAQLVDFAPAPGSAASVLAAFTLEKGKSLAIPAGFRIGSKPEAPNPAAAFETATALAASAALNAIPLSAVAPTNQFAPLASFATVFNRATIDRAALSVALVELYGTAGATFLPSLLFAEPLFELVTFKTTVARTVVLRGTANRVAAGDYVLVVEHEGGTGEARTVLQPTAVTTDKTANTTTVTWYEDASKIYATDVPVRLYAFRVVAAAFGSTAPPWINLPATLTNSDGLHTGAPYASENWDDTATVTNAWPYLPVPSSSNNTHADADQVFLDAAYPAVSGTPEQTTWAVLQADGVTPQVVHVTDARTISVNAYTVTAKATRLTFQENVTARTFPIRSTTIRCASERLVLQNDLPLPSQVSGQVIVLAGTYPQLRAGQTVVLEGTRADTSAPDAEAGTIDGPPVIDADNALTTITLAGALSHTYERAGAVLAANAVVATQGETVAHEILGSGDGSANQSFVLKKKPLTYLPATGADGGASVTSTLVVAVNGVEWTEVPTLLGAAPDDQVYTTSLDDTGQTTITFGDGINGARPPTAKDAIVARYRKGMGTYGNVAAGKVSQLLAALAGVQKVTNPQSAYGGADAETIDAIRVDAPNRVRAFGRAVGVDDYAALARTYPGIAKASASWMRRGRDLIAIAHPFVLLTVATADLAPLASQPLLKGNLRSFLDARRDPNVPLRIIDVTPVYLDVALTVDVLDRYPRRATIAAVLAALAPNVNPDGSFGFFAFGRLDFGRSIPLSAVYAAVQNVPGVRSSTIATFRRLDLDASDPTVVRDEIFIRPTEIAAIGNDPSAPQHGFVRVTLGSGGFADA